MEKLQALIHFKQKQKAVCTKRSCDIIFMQRKLYDFDFKKPSVGHVLNKIIVI